MLMWGIEECAQLAPCSCIVCKSVFAVLDRRAVLILCLVYGNEALPNERRVLNSTNGQVQWKVAMTKLFMWPAGKCTETKASIAFL